MVAFALVLTGVLLNAAAQLFLKAGTNAIGHFDFALANIIPIGLKVAGQPTIIAGLACYAVSVVVWIMASFLNVDLKLDERRAARLSPAYMPPATRAPLITAVGGLESSEFKRQNALIGERWRANLRADVPMPGRHHLSVIEGLAEPGNPLFEAALGLCLAR